MAGESAANCCTGGLGKARRAEANHRSSKGLADSVRHFNCFLQNGSSWCNLSKPKGFGMAYKEIFWMTCDSTEQLRAEYGPFHNREEAEQEARKLGFGYLLRYEHMIGENEEIQEVRCVFLELPAEVKEREKLSTRLHTRCATCGESSTHEMAYLAEVWADIHEFEHSRHLVRLFEVTRGEGLREIEDWRDTCA